MSLSLVFYIYLFLVFRGLSDPMVEHKHQVLHTKRNKTKQNKTKQNKTNCFNFSTSKLDYNMTAFPLFHYEPAVDESA